MSKSSAPTERNPLKFVMLEYAYSDLGVRKKPDPPLHIYPDVAPPTRTLCGLDVPTQAYGWFATGCPLDDPGFPFGPLCAACVKVHQTTAAIGEVNAEIARSSHGDYLNTRAPEVSKSSQTGHSISDAGAEASTEDPGRSAAERPHSDKSGH